MFDRRRFWQLLSLLPWLVLGVRFSLELGSRGFISGPVWTHSPLLKLTSARWWLNSALGALHGSADTILLIGGSLYRQGDLEAATRRLREAVEQVVAKKSD